MTQPSAMARETAESPAVVAALVADRSATQALAASLDIAVVPFVVICGRGSSGHAGVFLRYLVETRLGLPVSMMAPSVVTALGGSLRLKGALFVTISQSGGSPDLVAATRSARRSGARTLALLNVADSPVGREAEFILPLKAGLERSVAATKSVIASMVAAAELVACLAADEALAGALRRLPSRLATAAELDWSQVTPALASAHAVFVTGRGYGLATAREIALKLSETLRLPALAYSAAELMHGPRAAISPATPVLAFRQADPTAEAVDTLVAALRLSGVGVHDCGGARGSLAWSGDDHPVTDAITLLMPAYRLIEATAQSMGFDPDNPPFLQKVTATL